MTLLVQNLGFSASLRLPRERVAAQPSRARGRASVMLLLVEGDYPTASLRCALELSRSLRAALHVVRILPRLATLNAWIDQLSLVDSARAVERTLRAHRATREWVNQALAQGDAVERVQVLEGDLIAETVRYALGVDPSLIVVPPRQRHMGRRVISLAQATGVAVLVAREARAETEQTIVAATDLESPAYPVLHEAAELGRYLAARVVVVHNVQPMSVVVGTGTGWPSVSLLPADPARPVRVERLRRAARALPGEVHPVVRDDISPVDAILAEAGQRNAGVVVVGTRRRTWFERLLSGGVAAQVVDRSTRSVLVTPIDAPEAQ